MKMVCPLKSVSAGVNYISIRSFVRVCCVCLPKYASSTDPLRVFVTFASPSTAGDVVHFSMAITSGTPSYLEFDAESTVPPRTPSPPLSLTMAWVSCLVLFSPFELRPRRGQWPMVRHRESLSLHFSIPPLPSRPSGWPPKPSSWLSDLPGHLADLQTLRMTSQALRLAFRPSVWPSTPSDWPSDPQNDLSGPLAGF